MIQIPANLKPENFITEPLAQNKNNKTMNNPTKIPLNNYTIKEIRNLFFIEYKILNNRDFIEKKVKNSFTLYFVTFLKTNDFLIPPF